MRLIFPYDRRPSAREKEAGRCALLVEPVDIAAIVDGAQVMEVPHHQRIEASDQGVLTHSEREDVLDRFRRRD